MSSTADIWPLLKALAPGDWISGAQLADKFGISREALSRRMRKLQRTYDVQIDTQAGRGYRLIPALNLLDVRCLQTALSSEIKSAEFVVHPSIDSTNKHLHDNPQLKVCLAEHQSGGRGRRGRNWHSPLGQNIYLSVRHQLDHWPARLPALGLVLGVTICQQMKQRFAVPMGLKWPNDLYLNGRKCGGMLIEQKGEAQGGCELVIGLGLNADMQQAEIDQAWTSLAIEGHKIDRNELAVELIQILINELKQLDDARFASRLGEFSSYDTFAGQRVKLLGSDGISYGQAIGVDDSGRLRLRTSHGEELFSVGDISLRKDS